MFRLGLYHEVVRRCMGTFLRANLGIFPVKSDFTASKSDLLLRVDRTFTASRLGREIFSQILAERKRG